MKLFKWAGAVALALLSLNACFPDDYLDETDPVIPEKPEQKPETEKPETEKPGEEIPEFTGPLELNVVGRYLKDAFMVSARHTVRSSMTLHGIIMM